jgi:hypothetical protein
MAVTGGESVDTHTMALTATDRSGLQEWTCGLCGRRMLIRWPEFDRTVLDRGDEAATHVGGVGGVVVGGVGVVPAVAEPERRWLAESGISWNDAA